MLINLLVAASSGAKENCLAYGHGPQWPGFEANGLDNSVLAALWVATKPSGDASGLQGEDFRPNVVTSGS